MNPVLYAVGDVHGRDDLLEELHGRIRDYHGLMHPARSAKIIHVGDYVDRGPDSVKVIDRLIKGVDGFQVTCLLGNHEAMMLECLSTDNRQAWYTWLSNGGEETLSSLGIRLQFGGYDPEELASALGPKRIAWLRALEMYHLAEPYLFVHAGIAPEVPLEHQQPKDLLWIRSRFLDSDVNHGYIIVHGHTPGDEPVVKHNRMCVDTGAASTGILVATVLDGEKPPVFIRAEDNT